MEVVKAPARQYAFTLRKTVLKLGPINQESYFKHIEKWETAKLCRLVDSVFEYTSGIHMHGILEIPEGVNFKRFRVRGWNIVLEELYDQNGWRYYMMKEQKCKDDNEEYIDEHFIYSLTHSLFKTKRGET